MRFVDRCKVKVVAGDGGNGSVSKLRASANREVDPRTPGRHHAGREPTAMSSLSRLTLRGFKSIREMDLTFGPLNVLIGPNGAGKSNLVTFFRLLNALVEGGLQTFVGRQGGANAVLHHGRKRTHELHAEAHFGDQNARNSYAMSLVAVAPDDLMFSEEQVSYEPKAASAKKFVLGGGHRESRFDEAITAGNETAQTVRWNFDRWRVYHFHDTSADAAIKQGWLVSDNRFLRSDGANLAAFLYMLKKAHAPTYERIRATIRMAAPFFDDFVLEPDALNSNYISLQWRQRGSDAPFFAHQLSDGTLRFIALTTVLQQPSVPTDATPHHPHRRARARSSSLCGEPGGRDDACSVRPYTAARVDPVHRPDR